MELAFCHQLTAQRLKANRPHQRTNLAQQAPASFAARLDQWFSISERGTNLRMESLAALTTFASMSHVLAVRPTIMA